MAASACSPCTHPLLCLPPRDHFFRREVEADRLTKRYVYVVLRHERNASSYGRALIQPKEEISVEDTAEQVEQTDDAPPENPYATAAFDTVNGEFIHGNPHRSG